MRQPLRRLLAGLSLGLFACTLPLVPAAQASTASQVVIGAVLEPSSLDITGASGAEIPQLLLGNVYEGLLRIAEDGSIKPQLATRHTVSTDGKTHTFTLKNARFHDGSRVTASDVAWSLKRLIDPRSPVTPDLKGQFDRMASVRTSGTNTVVVQLKTRDNDFEFNLTQRGGAIFKARTTNFANTANGTGPYKLGAWNRGTSIALQRNDQYHGTRAKTKTVVFRYILDSTALSNAMLSGQIDIMTTVQSPELLDAFRKRNNLKVWSGSTTFEVVMSMNNSRAPLNNVKVRQAIRQAIDKRALVKTAWAGYGLRIGSFVPPTDPWYENLSNRYPYDLKKSRQLLAEAGYPNGFNLTLDVPGVPYALASQEFIAASLAMVGINVTIRPVSFGEWISRVFLQADYDMTIIAHVEPNDMAIYANPNYYFRFNSAQYQRLITEAREAETKTARTAALRRAARILADQHASDWLWLLPNIQVAKNSVTGFPLRAFGGGYVVANIVKK
jgi:peptide/nickel transport system substrate-binding protein